MNTNCLEGLACPECQSEGPFTIRALTMATMSDDGCEETSDIEWEDTSVCICRSCQYGATVGVFRVPNAT